MKVMWTVAELGLPHTRIDAGGKFGGLDTPAYTALNPNRKVPVIKDGDLVLWESNAIVRYLADRYGKGTLAPSDRNARAHADQWIDFAATGLVPDVMGGIFLQLAYTKAADRNLAAVAAAAERAAEKLSVLDAQLTGRPFILGDTLTIADIVVGGALHRYYTMPVTRPSRPNVEAYYKRLTERPAYKAHVIYDWQDLKVPGA